MARILGVDLPKEKKIKIALTYIRGIGDSTAQKVLEKAQIDPEKVSDDLTNEEIAKIADTIQSLGVPTEGELRRIVSSNIKRLKDIKCYRGTRHRKNLPVRGQKTRTNARTRKGKKRTVGGLKRVVAKK